MIRPLLGLALLVPAGLAEAQYEVIQPVQRKPETPPPPPVSPPMRVEPDGQVSDTRIFHSSGYPALDEAARTALALCHFKPGTIDGQPEAAWAHIRYSWVPTP